MNDKEFAKKILEGNQSSWKVFVEQYTDWVLYTAWEFDRKFCRFLAQAVNCSLLLIMRQQKGEKDSFNNNIESCDEGIDLYLWLFQQLRGKLKSYRGESKLSTYIWTILNSKTLYIDLLRWKYGRVDEDNIERLPAAIQKLPETERKVFVLLRRKKDEEVICQKLQLDHAAFQKSLEQVREALLHAGQLDLLERPELKSFEPWDTNQEKQYLNYFANNNQEEIIIDQVFIQQLVDKIRSGLDNLTPAEKMLAKLYYYEGFTGKEIVKFCSTFEEFSLEIDGKKVNSKNVYYLLGKTTDRLVSAINFEVNGQKLTQKQWMKALTVLCQEGIW